MDKIFQDWLIDRLVVIFINTVYLIDIKSLAFSGYFTIFLKFIENNETIENAIDQICHLQLIFRQWP